jgi:clan AA aspartic protease
LITGQIAENDDSLVALALVSGRRRLRVSAVVDTGFSGYLSVPDGLVRTIGWRPWGMQRCKLADGRIVRQRVYIGLVAFGGRRHSVLAVRSQGGEVLIGTKLLSGRLCEFDYVTRVVRIRKGGVVRSLGIRVRLKRRRT